MAKSIRNAYQPDRVSPPGETLVDTLDALGISQSELAERTGRPVKTINEIANGKAAITPETALQFERVLGVPARFWNNRESQYRESMARQEELARLEQHVSWLDQFPVKAMIKLGWVEDCDDKVRLVQALLNFFGIASPQLWQERWASGVMSVAFRKSTSFESDPGATAAWLRRGELEATAMQCAPFDESEFVSALERIRELTTLAPEDYAVQMKALCAGSGVAVVFVPELPGMRANGASRWLTPSKALIQLSLRYKTDDHLWFAFFHESGHILKHGKREFFIDVEHYGTDPKEMEANRFAGEVLIPAKHLNDFMAQGDKSQRAVERFARDLRIAPGIVVGRLQHEGYLPRTHLNGLKQKLTWAQ
jgi:HTH-type transcriptional regulator / antitoxin HigA